VNLIDELRGALEVAGLEDGLSIVGLREAGQSDLAVIVRQAEDLPEAAARAAAALKEHPGVASVKRTGQRLLLRFDRALVAELGAKLEEGDGDALAVGDLHAEEPCIVEFCDPNATKGLHIGHLRNIAIGQAIACALEAAGARVERQCQISDAGQQVGEAMAGYLLYADGATPESAGRKGDHFVGDLYARYVSESAVGTEGVSEQDLAVARELTKRDDLATSLLDRWLLDDEEVVELWAAILDWVLSGQRETLTRLGIHFDRPLMESSFLPQLTALMELGVERGVLTYAESGALVYETGREEYPSFPLARPDGFSTLNLRSLTIWNELMSELGETTLVHVTGMEWKEHTICVKDILERLRPGEPLQPTYDVLHGMVSTETGIASSSEGNVVLVDDLLDGLAGSSAVGGLAIEGRRDCEADDLAVLIALGFFLDRPAYKPLKATPAAMLDEQTSTGMLLARAWVKAWDPEADGDAEPDPDDPVYRFTVMQSQVYRQMLQLGLEQVDMLGLVRFLARFSEWYLDQPAGPATARAMRSVLGQGLRSLGLVRSNASVPAAAGGLGGE
jgi:arginyl-tRNA synthetase